MAVKCLQKVLQVFSLSWVRPQAHQLEQGEKQARQAQLHELSAKRAAQWPNTLQVRRCSLSESRAANRLLLSTPKQSRHVCSAGAARAARASPRSAAGCRGGRACGGTCCPPSYKMPLGAQLTAPVPSGRRTRRRPRCAPPSTGGSSRRQRLPCGSRATESRRWRGLLCWGEVLAERQLQVAGATQAAEAARRADAAFLAAQRQRMEVRLRLWCLSV